ncbi:MAG: hypothetical protein ACYTGZ_20685 [Planctomycetota bacterium]|jgi:hypothetical protein
MHLFRIQSIVAGLLLCTTGSVLAEERAPTREEFESLKREVAQLKSERSDLQKTLAARGSDDVEADVEKYLAQQSTYPQPERAGLNRFLMTGFAWANFENVEGQDSTFRAAFVPIFLWQLNDRILFEAEVEIGLDEEETEVHLGYAQLLFIVNDWLTIGVGKFLTPFGTFWERWHPAWINRLPTAPLVYTHHGGIVGESLIGIQARGGVRLGKTLVNYAVYFANGPTLGEHGHDAGRLEWERNFDNNNNKTFGGRVGVLPVPHVEIGVSLLTGTVGDSGSEYSDVDTLIIGFDFWFGREIDAIKGYLEIRSDFAWVETDTAEFEDEDEELFLFDNNTRQGWFIQVAWRPTQLDGFVKNIELVVRFDSTLNHGPHELGIDQTRISIGANYWVLENVPVKFVWFQDRFSEGPDQAGVILQAAVGF